MDAVTPYLKDLIALAGVLAGAAGVWHASRTKTRTEAQAAAADDALDADRAVDARWQAMLEQQRADFALVITPIREDVDNLRREVRELHTALDVLRNRYRAAIDYLHALLGWARAQPAAATAPAVPAPLVDEV
ncbi:hypothetical protein [Nocardia terpenica]|nr:hypothetical protein [Nocardia terpenica]NQE86250.1 hypothetical protein [Nocardia terpenica]